MSDLESVLRARDAIITEVAGGKLRSLARGGGDQASHEGLLDAFAEVFARMSQSKMAVPQDEQVQPSEDATKPPSDAPLESETESQRDDSQQHCVAWKQDDRSTEDVELPVTAVAEIEALKDVVPEPGEDVEALEATDIEIEVTIPVVAEALETEVETPEITEEQVPQVMPRDDGDDADPGEVDAERRRKVRPSSDSKSLDPKPRQNTREGQVENVEDVEPETVPAEFDEELESPIEKPVGQVRHNRRASPRDGRHSEPSQAKVSQNVSREAALKVDSMLNPEIQEAAGSTGHASSHRQGLNRNMAAAVNRSVQAATVASSVASSGGSNTTRFGATPGNGIREVVQNPSVGATAKVTSRTATEARGKKVDTTDTLARVKLIQRVSKAFQHLGPEGGVIRLRLAPAEMGSVRVEMRIQQRKVAARVVAETEAASAALREHLPDLRSRLESFGMQVEQLDIETENLDHDGGSHFKDTESRDERWQQPDQRQQRERTKQLQTKNVVDVSQHVSPVVTTSSVSAGIDVHL